MKYLFSLLFVFLLNLSYAQNTLEVTINGIKILEGNIKVALYNNSLGWDKDMKSHLGENVYEGKIVNADSSSIKVIFKNLPSASYAISLFHDVNSSGLMDMGGFLKLIPQEPFGFYNNFVPKMSAPKFPDCSFFINEKEMKYIKIELIER